MVEVTDGLGVGCSSMYGLIDILFLMYAGNTNLEVSHNCLFIFFCLLLNLKVDTLTILPFKLFQCL